MITLLHYNLWLPVHIITVESCCDLNLKVLSHAPDLLDLPTLLITTLDVYIHQQVYTKAHQVENAFQQSVTFTDPVFYPQRIILLLDR